MENRHYSGKGSIQLFDPYNRPIDKIPQKPDLDMVGTMRIRDRWSGYPSVKLTPEKLASIYARPMPALLFGTPGTRPTVSTACAR